MWDAGAIVGSMRLNINEYAQGMLQVESIAHFFPQIVTDFLEEPLIGFADVAKESMKGLWEAIEGTATRFHQIGLAAENLGVSTAFISTLGAVAKAKSIDIEQLGMSLKFLQQRAADALSGDTGAAKGFADIGVGIKELRGLVDQGVESMFYRVAAGISSIENPALRVQAASDLMSRAGFKMVSLFEQGPDKIKAMQQAMGDLGARVTDEQAKMGEGWGVLESKFSATFQGIQSDLATGFLKGLTGDTENIDYVLKDVRKTVLDISNTVMPMLSGVRETMAGLDALLNTNLLEKASLSLPLTVDFFTGGYTNLTGREMDEIKQRELARGVGPLTIKNEININGGDAFHASEHAGNMAKDAVRNAVLAGYKKATDQQTQKVARAVGAKNPTHYYPGIGH